MEVSVGLQRPWPWPWALGPGCWVLGAGVPARRVPWGFLSL